MKNNMKYIKMFENYKSKVFWVVDNTDEYFETRLFKIGLSLEDIKKFRYYIFKNNDENKRHYYLGYNPVRNKWSYENYNYTSGSNFYDAEDYEFMGHVDLTEEDKWNYENSPERKKVNKYNL